MNGVFLTGATGLLGRYVLLQLLLADREVAVLTRTGSDGISGRDRIDDALRYFETQLERTLPRPTVVEGRLHEPGLGLSEWDRRRIGQHCTAVVHCAASIKFEQDGNDEEPYRSNVVGTQQLIEFCSGVGIREFHHVSTAYVCGDRQGRIFEDDLNRGQLFRNDYERSKYAGEQLLHGATCFQSLTTYRPSIIVGDSETAYSSTFHGFYLPLQLAHLATSAGLLEGGSGYMAALGLEGSERKNLVPVNWVADVLVHIFQRPQLHGQTYHLTNPYPVTTAELEAAITDSIQGDRGIPVAARSSGSIQVPSLEGFREQMNVYAAYLRDDPDFDTQHTDAAAPGRECPRMTHETLVRLARFAIESRFGWPRRRPRPVELDVRAFLLQIPHPRGIPPSASTLRFEVSGSYGGVWQVSFHDKSLIGVSEGCLGDSDYSAYLNVHTLRDILAGNQTVAEALASAQLVFEGQNDRISQGPLLFETLCQRIRQSQ